MINKMFMRLTVFMRLKRCLTHTWVIHSAVNTNTHIHTFSCDTQHTHTVSHSSVCGGSLTVRSDWPLFLLFWLAEKLCGETLHFLTQVRGSWGSLGPRVCAWQIKVCVFCGHQVMFKAAVRRRHTHSHKHVCIHSGGLERSGYPANHNWNPPPVGHFLFHVPVKSEVRVQRSKFNRVSLAKNYIWGSFVVSSHVKSNIFHCSISVVC